ncbi:MAG: RNA pseudouridine synthase [Paludibacteraceae bacterium]|nr:RNA pseudouridine synthase [Paludibacteraceae bacterium]
MEILYEDNHLIIVNKAVGEIVQGDKTGDEPLVETLKRYIKEKYDKPGDVFLGVTHRLDRPVSGVVVFARTSKALERMNKLFADHTQIKKTYWAIVCGKPEMEEGTLEHYLVRNEKMNKSFAYDHEKSNSKKAILDYKVIAYGDRYSLLNVNLKTGRHHQIRCQLAAMGCPIKGDLKYGAPRSNPDGGISLHARSIEFIHPVQKTLLSVVAELPEGDIWKKLLR